MRLITFFVLAAVLAFAQDRPLDNIASRQYQHEVRPLRLALDRWLHGLGFQDADLSIRLVKASDLPPNSCGMSTYDRINRFWFLTTRSQEQYSEDGDGIWDVTKIPILRELVRR
jgi:hypothetical protein